MDILKYINETPELLSLLYDMGLLPEQHPENSRDWNRCMMLSEAWKENSKSKDAIETIVEMSNTSRESYIALQSLNPKIPNLTP